MKTPTDAGADEAFAVAVVEVAREASTEATGELVARSYFDTALAQLEFRRLGGAARQRETHVGYSGTQGNIVRYQCRGAHINHGTSCAFRSAGCAWIERSVKWCCTC